MDYTNLTPCPTDEGDQPDCYWNAATMGNGQGTSFVIVNGEVISCAPGQILAEDFSCVGGDFYDEPAPVATETPAPVVSEAPVPAPAPVVTQEVVSTPAPAPYVPDTLAATGADDVSPLTLVAGALLIVAGLAFRKLGKA